jgi:hypothetical protein
MKPFAKITFITAGVSTVVLGSSAFAYAGWTTTSPSTVLSVSAASVPDGPRPTAVVRGHTVDLSWARKKVSASVPAQRYLIRRHGAAEPIIVCTVSTPGCEDTDVPPGEWTYTVRLLLQTWEGSDGPPTAPVTVGDTQADEPADPGTDEQVDAPDGEPPVADDEVTPRPSGAPEMEPEPADGVDDGVAPGGSAINPEPTEAGDATADQELGSPSGTLAGSTGAVTSE